MSQRRAMSLSVIGTGYVGLVTSACFADLGHTVIAVDQDADRLKLLEAGRVPFYEPGLEDLLKRALRSGRITFTTDTADAVRRSEVIFITVGTPSREAGDADLSAVAAVAEVIAPALTEYRLIVEKSTVPARTGARIRDQIHLLTRGAVPFDVACNPEFLREGSAVHDFLHPDRIVLGVESERSERLLRELYAPFDCPVVVTDLSTAELIKHASNAFLAMKISYINAVANVCERVGADVRMVADGMGYDARIGRAYLDAGVGYGGSCFPKDVAAFVQLAREAGYDFRLLEEVARVNDGQRDVLLRLLKDALWVIANRTVTILGLAFKPNTDDMRGAPSVAILEALRREGAVLRAHDPAAEANARQILPYVTYFPDPYEAARGSDAVVVLTDWKEFRTLDLPRLKSLMRRPVLIDGRNILDPQAARAAGFHYAGIGR
ncbi:MAG TPA: UDP-glucose/GDP-mannose dehydrogenase family protein [bacterium]|nr:UDP-glucose/GDP-mannose dehydrogenase family protein [bacterium]